MPTAASKYKTLSELTVEWSNHAGELPLLTLRRICDWAICDAFPPGTFVTPNGDAIDLLDLHRAMRIVVGIRAPMNEEVARGLLFQTMVSKDGIKDYCERIGVDPPPSLASLTSRLRRLGSATWHRGPPDCPNSNKVVAKVEEGLSAIAMMWTMRSGLRPESSDFDPENAKDANERWRRYFECVQSKADASGEPEVQKELAILRQKWETSKGTTNEVASEESPSLEEDLKKRGRPEGSGSFEREDRLLAEEMREGVLSGKFTSRAAAAREAAPRASGGGTLASKEKRLCKRYGEIYPG
jgi:hypothetical protein